MVACIAERGGKRERKNAMRLAGSVMPLLALPLLGLLAACSKGEEPTPAARAAAPPSAVASPGPTVGSAPAVPRSVRQSDELIEFEYSYPAEAGAIPALKAYLDADLDKRKAALIAGAREQLAESRKGGFDYRPLGNWIAWKVVTDLPGWLSLSAEISDYSGGAHPNHGFDTILWDKQAAERRDPLDMFTSGADLSRAIRKDFCAALDKQRAQKRGEPVKPGSTDEFDQCIDPVESTVVLGSSNRRTFDRIGVLVAPYAAGPYFEGDYEVTLPVTAAVLAAVRPERRSSFATSR
jgi:hypothetical protein